MDISVLLKKENAQYGVKLIRKTSTGFLLMIELLCVSIAFIVDYNISYTFPSYTLITILVCLIIVLCKIYAERREDIVKKETAAKYIECEYKKILPILNHLSDTDRDLLKPLAEGKNYIELTFEKRIQINNILAQGLFNYIDIKEYPGLPSPYAVMIATQTFILIIKKYFEELEEV